MKTIALAAGREYIKLCVPLLAVFLFTSCSNNAQQQAKNSVADPAKIEKNKQIAQTNAAIEVTQAAQKLEKQGRDMEALRQAVDAESARQCHTVMEDRQEQVKNLEAKVSDFPNNFKTRLIPIINDLNVCVSCSKTAMTSCVKTRASLNEAISEMFPK
ncbi:MAG: hypothetical protein M3033_05430 [Acidobacteriota bacterium]|nr:hypothetical protein [Acidobacteriota bacterium]